MIQHDSIIATTWDRDVFRRFEEWLKSRSEDEQSLVIRGGSWINSYKTFVVLPDGSKEGWEESEKGNAFRKAVIHRLEADCYSDGSSPWSWVEVSFGECGTHINGW